ncbi:MAG: polysaccharide deacetylase family protein [Flavobacteriales bacterium]|nr:polysaccharide deacetylase family protein [Flavobacteriales bacterium]
MITIYCEKITPRVKYTFHLVFEAILGLDYELMSDEAIYLSSDEAKFTYGIGPIDEGIFVRASGLLFESDIIDQSLEVGELDGIPAFYRVDQPSFLEYDLFSAIFYLVSRYEEYLPHIEDGHGRYQASQSIAFQNGFLGSPIVDRWAQLIGRLLMEKFPTLAIASRSFHYLNTIDIDNAYAYAGKGGLRNVGGMAKSALRLDKNDLSKRLNVLGGKAKDPYDTYSYMQEQAAKYNTAVKSFVLLGDYGPYDKNLPHSSAEQIRAIQHMAAFSEVGMHPSYGSAGDLGQVKKEMSRLSGILGRSIRISRQHYLKLKMPNTYRILIECGVEEDHSMGYSEVLGFRAGTCTPFKFYDLEAETSTDLIVYPFAVMDRTLNDYLKLNPDEAIQHLHQLVKEVRAVGGTLISVWHNESLSDALEWKGWLPVYEQLQACGIEEG